MGERCIGPHKSPPPTTRTTAGLLQRRRTVDQDHAPPRGPTSGGTPPSAPLHVGLGVAAPQQQRHCPPPPPPGCVTGGGFVTAPWTSRVLVPLRVLCWVSLRSDSRDGRCALRWPGEGGRGVRKKFARNFFPGTKT